MNGGAPTADALLDALEATWPCAHREEDGGLVLRDDAPEAGSRVRSARLSAGGEPIDWDGAADRIERFYAERGGPALLQAARADAAALDTAQNPFETALQAKGFAPFDPCVLTVGDCAAVAERAAGAGVHAVEILTPLAILDRFWEGGGVGAARRAVMRRALDGGLAGGVLAARIDSRFQGAAFWAVAPGGLAFVHAVHVAPEARRKGGARALLGFAAERAAEAGAQSIGAATRVANAPARALFEGCGFHETGGYVYWRKAL